MEEREHEQEQVMTHEGGRESGQPWLLVVVLVVLVFSALGYAFYQHDQAQRLAQQNTQMTSQLSQTQGQIDALTTRLNDMAAAEQARQAEAAKQRVARARTTRVPRDDPRWKKFQSQLDAQGKVIDEHGKAIDAARQDLTSARGELGDSIAHTHAELVVLQKKGERSYYEFDLAKSKQFQREGPVGIRLKKASTKHSFADLELMVDDRDLSQKHVNLFQPVMFYAGDNGQPIQLVINSVGKNRIHGYVSEPKYTSSELAKMTPSAQSGADAAKPSAATVDQRQKLELKQE